MRYATLSALICLYFIVHGQQTYFHTCERSLYFLSSSAQPISYKYLDVIITNHTTCGYSYEITVDVNSYTVPDNFILYESINDTFIEIFQSGWIGHSAYWPYGSLVNVGYYEIVDGLPIRENERCDSLPLDFYWQRWGTCNGFGRIRFSSSAAQIKIRCELNFVHTSYIEFSIHCGGFMEPQSQVRRTEYVCYKPAQIHEISYSHDCLKEISTDSIYVGDIGAWTDTLYLLSGQYHNVKGQRLWIDSEVYIRDSTVNQYGCVVPIGTLIIPYDLKVFIPNIFTPNNDGHNDFFSVSTGKDVEVIEMKIFDRWGGVVFTGLEWDGGVSMPGVYVYQVKVRVKDIEKMYSGDLTLVR